MTSMTTILALALLAPAVFQVQGEVLDPETGRAIPEASIFFEGRPDSVRTDAEGRFALAAVAGAALVIEHPEYRGLRFPAEYLEAGAEILAVPHLLEEVEGIHRPQPLMIVVGPGARLTGTVSPGEGTWCGADDPQRAVALDSIETILIISSDGFGATALSGVVLVTCREGA